MVFLRFYLSFKQKNSTMDSECVMCGEKIKLVDLYNHIPRCYYQLLITKGEVPKCTCMKCKGLRSHDGDYLTVQNKPSTSTSFLPLIQPTLDPNNLTPDKLCGKECLICENRTITKSLPIINIGRYRKVGLCKKAHITDDCNDIATKLDAILEKVSDCNDGKASVLDGSDDEDLFLDYDQECKGCTTAEAGKECGKPCKALMYLNANDEKQYFCKGSHLVRYLLVFYCSHKAGKKGSKKKSTSKKTSQSSNKPSNPASQEQSSQRVNQSSSQSFKKRKSSVQESDEEEEMSM